MRFLFIATLFVIFALSVSAAPVMTVPVASPVAPVAVRPASTPIIVPSAPVAATTPTPVATGVVAAPQPPVVASSTGPRVANITLTSPTLTPAQTCANLESSIASYSGIAKAAASTRALICNAQLLLGLLESAPSPSSTGPAAPRPS